MAFETGPAYQKPGEIVDWIISVQSHLVSWTQFIGVSNPAIGRTVMWGLTGTDRDGKLLGGVKRWYDIDNSGRVWQHFRMLVTKEGGDTGDYFTFQFHTLILAGGPI